jgi:glutamate N-acetyltransferase/amino-acid N-acetyltransferase
MTTTMKQIANGSVTTPQGFSAAAVACGLKGSGDLDIALVYSTHDCRGAGVFTQNKAPAAPVLLDRETLSENPHRLRGVVINAGVANACTGSTGMENARATQHLVAQALDCEQEQVLVLSTGVIGVHLDMNKIASGIRQAADTLSPKGGLDAALAIMTTDTHPKHIAYSIDTPDGTITLGGIAKGAGMIHPNMATMLAVITTDAAISSEHLGAALRSAVDQSFNRILVDGDTSTNDTVLLLANGVSGVSLESQQTLEAFEIALEKLCIHLAQAIVRDGEGASKFVTLHVTGASTAEQAEAAARCVASSPLVKTAFAGGDPNWGRVIAAAGRAGVDLDPDRLALWIGLGDQADLLLVHNGTPTTYAEPEAAAIFASQEFCVRLDLGVGFAEAMVWTCDLTKDYVTINADYHT